jgi:hypothetical protein
MSDRLHPLLYPLYRQAGAPRLWFEQQRATGRRLESMLVAWQRSGLDQPDLWADLLQNPLADAGGRTASVLGGGGGTPSVAAVSGRRVDAATPLEQRLAAVLGRVAQRLGGTTPGLQSGNVPAGTLRSGKHRPQAGATGGTTGGDGYRSAAGRENAASSALAMAAPPATVVGGGSPTAPLTQADVLPGTLPDALPAVARGGWAAAAALRPAAVPLAAEATPGVTSVGTAAILTAAQAAAVWNERAAQAHVQTGWISAVRIPSPGASPRHEATETSADPGLPPLASGGADSRVRRAPEASAQAVAPTPVAQRLETVLGRLGQRSGTRPSPAQGSILPAPNGAPAEHEVSAWGAGASTADAGHWPIGRADGGRTASPPATLRRGIGEVASSPGPVALAHSSADRVAAAPAGALSGEAAGWPRGLRGLARRAAAYDAAPGAPHASPPVVVAATAPSGTAGAEPADDDQIAEQLARVLRREAQREGIDVDDLGP